MDITILLGYLQEEIENGQKVMLSNKVSVDRQKCLDILEDIIRSLPVEIEEAQSICAQRDKIIQDAQNEAENILVEAQKKAEELIDQEEITQVAYANAEDIIGSAHKSAHEIKVSANLYVDELLEDLENYIQKNLDIVQENRRSMQG